MENLKLSSFLGIDFGATIETAKEKLLNRSGSILDIENSDAETLMFNGLTFAGRRTTLVMLLFVDGKFAKSSVYLKEELEAHTVRTYIEIKNELNSKYFVTPDDFEIFEYPYEKHDGFTETGISTGKVEFSSFWKFEDANGGEDDYIALKISPEHYIIINYEDGDLSTALSDKAKNENSEDY